MIHRRLRRNLKRSWRRGRSDLPEKFGFAIDCGAERVLAQAPADIRLERGVDGGLIARADGASLGRSVTRLDAIETVLSLAAWFVASGGAQEWARAHGRSYRRWREAAG